MTNGRWLGLLIVGRWTFDAKGRSLDDLQKLRTALTYERFPGRTSLAAFWPVRLNKTWTGQIHLNVDPDDDWFYARLKDQ